MQEPAETQEDRAGLLLEFIQHYEFLYNLRHTDYKNNKRKMEAWNEIASVLNCTVDDCQRLWKTLRDRFTREKRDYLKSGSAAPESKWLLFDKMLFYEKCTKPRRTYTTTSRPSSALSSRPASAASISSGCSVWSTPLTTVESLSEAQNTETDEDQEQVMHAEDGPQEQGHIDESQQPGPSRTQVTPRSSMGPKLTPSETPSSFKTRRSVKRKAGEEEFELLKVAKNLASSIERSRTTANDTNRTFVEYVYSVLTDMPEAKARGIRKKILDIVLKDESS